MKKLLKFAKTEIRIKSGPIQSGTIAMWIAFLMARGYKPFIAVNSATYTPIVKAYQLSLIPCIKDISEDDPSAVLVRVGELTIVFPIGIYNQLISRLSNGKHFILMSKPYSSNIFLHEF